MTSEVYNDTDPKQQEKQGRNIEWDTKIKLPVNKAVLHTWIVPAVG